VAGVEWVAITLTLEIPRGDFLSSTHVVAMSINAVREAGERIAEAHEGVKIVTVESDS
jgi:hypothetical protein